MVERGLHLRNRSILKLTLGGVTAANNFYNDKNRHRLSFPSRIYELKR